MEKVVILTIFFACAVGFVRSDYVAAVLEYHPTNSSTANQTIEGNLREYVDQIEMARKQNVDIIVFPEYGLTGLVEEPEEYSLEIPETGSRITDFNYTTAESLKRLSHAADEHEMYVVVNLLEKAKDEKNKTIYYNTNVVFDKQGTLVAKYRKINLWNEPRLTPGENITTFKTDFGVTFGLMTCFDILYHNPSRTLLEDGTVTDIIFPHAWHSLLPLYMSLSIQSGYAVAAKVNLLAANLNRPTEGIGGSAIYQKGKTLGSVLTGKPQTTLIYANIVNPGRISLRPLGFGFIDNDTVPDMSNYNIGRAFDTDDYVYKGVDMGKEEISERLCDGKFCCNFQISLSRYETNQTEVYKMVAFNGRAKWGSGRSNVRFCGLVSCTTTDVSTCGVRPPREFTTVFPRISVWSSFPATPEGLYQPVGLLGNLRPVENVTYEEGRTNDTVSLAFNTTRAERNVVFVGLYGRGGAAEMGVSLAVVLAAAAMRMPF